MVACPVCGKQVMLEEINQHLDGCTGEDAEVVEIKTPTRQGIEGLGSQPKRSSGGSGSQPKWGGEGSGSQPKRVAIQSPGASPGTLPAAIAAASRLPLAERLRPTSLDDYVGQEHLVGSSGILHSFLTHKRLPLLILWGPPGSGKTTLARIMCKQLESRFVELSAILSGAADLKRVFTEAANELRLTKRGTIVFVDEIHRFNKAQQDVLLPAVERGTVTLVGATTENPLFKLNGALLLRCRVFVLKKLPPEALIKVMHRGLLAINQTRKHVLGRSDMLRLPKEALEYLASLANGDLRTALSLLEMVDAHAMSQNNTTTVDVPMLRQILKKTHMDYDRQGDAHYDTILAFHKLIRGSDADAAMFYLARMLNGGEDPLYIARRMIRIASEDVGVLDDSCLPFAVAAHSAVEKVGLPEADLALVHCAVKLARAPKLVQIYSGWKQLKAQLEEAPEVGNTEIPIHLRNAPTRLMAELGYGKEYKYNPRFRNGEVKQEYLPEGVEGGWASTPHLGEEVDPDL